jgi:hypothetical protein
MIYAQAGGPGGGPATYTFSKTPLDMEQNIQLQIDFSYTPQVKAGDTVTAVNWRMFLVSPDPEIGLVVSTDFSLSGFSIDPTGKIAQVVVTDVTAVPGQTYALVCIATLSNGPPVLVIGIQINVE